MNVVSNLVEAHIVKKTEDKLEFLLLKRSPDETYPNIWQMVTGSIKEGEKAYETAIREIKEETNLPIKHLWVVPKVNSFYSQKTDEIILIPVFVALVENESSLLLSDEHIESKWENKETAKKLLAWPGQRESVDVIYEYFISENSPLYLNKIF